MQNQEFNPFQLSSQQLSSSVDEALTLLKDHLDKLGSLPVKAQVEPGAVAAQFAQGVPESGQSLTELCAHIQKNLLPAVTHWQHPKFFAYYPASTSIPAIVSELIIATIGSVGLQWSANPAATELECIVMDWILDLLQAPKESPFRHTSRQGGGIIQNTAGEALTIVMVAARIQAHCRKHKESQTLSLEDLYWQDSSSLVAYMSDQTHFSGPKAVRVAGIRLRKLPAQRLANGNLGITAAQVREAMQKDREQGLTPCVVQLNFGSTNTCGYDDLASFHGFAESENVWIHVDAAYAGPAFILPEWQKSSHTLQDIATSFNFNGSKWFLCGFDSAFLFIRDRKLLKQVFSADGDYLARVHDEEVYNPELKDWSIPLGRRFRALRIWMVLSYFGREGLQHFLRRAIDQADHARARIEASSSFEHIVKTDLGLVCFKLKTDDKIKNESFIKKLEALSDHGKQFLIYPSLLAGESFLRLALGGVETELHHVDEFLDLCEKLAKEILA